MRKYINFKPNNKLSEKLENYNLIKCINFISPLTKLFNLFYKLISNFNNGEAHVKNKDYFFNLIIQLLTISGSLNELEI